MERKHEGDRHRLLVEAPETTLCETMVTQRKHVVAYGWHARFVCGSQLVVVFCDTVFTVSIAPARWDALPTHRQAPWHIHRNVAF